MCKIASSLILVQLEFAAAGRRRAVVLLMPETVGRAFSKSKQNGPGRAFQTALRSTNLHFCTLFLEKTALYLQTFKYEFGVTFLNAYYIIYVLIFSYAEKIRLDKSCFTSLLVKLLTNL